MSVEIAKIRKIPIKLHFTLIITFLLFAWTISTFFMPDQLPGREAFDYWTLGILATVLLFFSILVHELAHSIVALRYLIPVRSITLFVFGGISDISKEPGEFKKEFHIAIVGPVTSIILAGVFGVIIFLLDVALSAGSVLPVMEEVRAVVFFGMVINFMLAIFNLIPAFPLDGGRMLRSILLRQKDFYQATKISTKVGVAISYVFMGFGFVSLFSGNHIGGLWIVLIGWFLNSGAQSYMYQFELTHMLKDLRVEQIMQKNPISINHKTTLAQAKSEYFHVYMKKEFPVVNDQNKLIGVVGLKELSLPLAQDQDSYVYAVMVPKGEVVVLSPATKCDKALLKIMEKRQGKVFVCDEDGTLVGVLSKTDLINTAGERKEYLEGASRKN